MTDLTGGDAGLASYDDLKAKFATGWTEGPITLSFSQAPGHFEANNTEVKEDGTGILVIKWRGRESSHAPMTITAAEGYTIKSVTYHSKLNYKPVVTTNPSSTETTDDGGVRTFTFSTLPSEVTMTNTNSNYYVYQIDVTYDTDSRTAYSAFTYNRNDILYSSPGLYVNAKHYNTSASDPIQIVYDDAKTTLRTKINMVDRDHAADLGAADEVTTATIGDFLAVSSSDQSVINTTTATFSTTGEGSAFRIFCNGLKVMKPGTATLTYRFKGTSKYPAKQVAVTYEIKAHNSGLFAGEYPCTWNFSTTDWTTSRIVTDYYGNSAWSTATANTALLSAAGTVAADAGIDAIAGIAFTTNKADGMYLNWNDVGKSLHLEAGTTFTLTGLQAGQRVTITAPSAGGFSCDGSSLTKSDDNYTYDVTTAGDKTFTVTGSAATVSAITADYSGVSLDFVKTDASPNTTTVDDTEYPLLTLAKGGNSGKLQLRVLVGGTDIYDTVAEDITYTWTPIGTANNQLIVLDDNGTITTSKGSTGSALVTATYKGQTASYVVTVVDNSSKTDFRFGSSITIGYYDGAQITNQLMNATGTVTYKITSITANGVAISSSLDTYAKVSSGKDDKDQNGVVTIQEAAKEKLPMTITVTATDTKDGAATNYTYTLNVRNYPGFYSVASGKAPTVGQVVERTGIRATFGGFTTNFGKGDTKDPHKYGSDTDSWGKGKADVLGLDNKNYFFSQGNKNPKYEDGTNLRGWGGNRGIKTNNYAGWNVPVYGTYMQFEPEADGSLTLNVLQTGCVQATYGLIDKWDYKALYLIDERGNTVKATPQPKSHSSYTWPYTCTVKPDTAQFYQVELKPYLTDGNYTHGEEGRVADNRYLQYFTYGATVDECGGNTIEEMDYKQLHKEMKTAFGIDDGKDSTDPDFADITDEQFNTYITEEATVHIMENKRHGYWTITECNTEYTFPVKAGKVYYLFVDGSKLGFNSFNFRADNSVAATTLTIDGSDNRTTATPLNKKSNCTVTLNRTLKPNQPNTLCLPFTMSPHKVEEVFGNGTVVLNVKSIADRITFVRHHHQMITAGEPCIIYPTKEAASSWTISNVTVEDKAYLDRYVPVSSAADDEHGNRYTFMGCFQKEDMPAGSYWVKATSGGTDVYGKEVYIYRTPKDDYMSNTRCFFRNDSGDVNAKLFDATSFWEDAIDEQPEDSGVTDAIDTLPATIEQARQVTAIPGIYTLSGQRVTGDNLPKGIYIINGRKVAVK